MILKMLLQKYGVWNSRILFQRNFNFLLLLFVWCSEQWNKPHKRYVSRFVYQPPCHCEKCDKTGSL